MRGVIALLTATLSIAAVRVSAASDCLDPSPAVTVRIYDYVHLQGESLSQAQEIVTRVYRNVGVGIEWFGTFQLDVNRSRSPRRDVAQAPIAQLTINLLTPAMAARGQVAGDVLGFVAVPPEGGMGRIGYVVYDRVRQVAASGGTSEGEILGVILSHDIGRLILGVGSQSHSGVMKAHWNLRDLQRVDPLSLEFTPSEVARLRGTLESGAASSFPAAARGSEVADGCDAGLRDDARR